MQVSAKVLNVVPNVAQLAPRQFQKDALNYVFRIAYAARDAIRRSKHAFFMFHKDLFERHSLQQIAIHLRGLRARCSSVNCRWQYCLHVPPLSSTNTPAELKSAGAFRAL
jgi:hypothetical protein